MLGIAITGLLAAFMAGVAANVTAFNTVVSYDLWQAYVRKDEPDRYYVRFGRIATVLGIVIAIGTAFIAAGFNSIMDYIQALFSFFNAPLFATFIIAMFWRRATPWAGFWGLAAGTFAAVAVHFLHSLGPLDLGSPLAADFWGAGAVTVGVSLATGPKPDHGLRGLVWGLTETEDTSAEQDPAERVWWRRPGVLGGIALALYGVILTVMGLFASSDTKAKAAGININLWAGLVILAGGAVFIGWVLLRPLRPSDVQEAGTDRPKVE
jgi:solute:Na+ symporter, SSS family